MDPQPARPNDDGFGSYINAIGWLLLSLAGIVVGARIWAKISARKGLWWDDYIVIAAWVSISPSHARGRTDDQGRGVGMTNSWKP